MQRPQQTRNAHVQHPVTGQADPWYEASHGCPDPSRQCVEKCRFKVYADTSITAEYYLRILFNRPILSLELLQVRQGSQK